MAKKIIKLCKEDDCKNEQTTMGYCRFHYLKNWKKIREKQRKKAIANLNKYVEHVMHKHPENYVETIKQDLRFSDRFQKKAEDFFADEDFHDIMEGVNIEEEVENILDNLKVDETF